MSSWGWNKNIEGGVKREGEGVCSGGRDATAGDVNNVIAPLARDVASEGIRRHVLTHSYTPCSTQYVAATRTPLQHLELDCSLFGSDGAVLVAGTITQLSASLHILIARQQHRAMRYAGARSGIRQV